MADRITVIRRGKVVGEASPTSTSAELASLMVGRPVKLEIEKEAREPGEEMLTVEDLRVVDDTGQVTVDGVSFSVRGGEIYALAGVQGNGQTELHRGPGRPRDRGVRHGRSSTARTSHGPASTP